MHVQPEEVDVRIIINTKKTYPRSCALIATTPAKRGPMISDERPAAAAAASKWPRFDLRDVHWTDGPPDSLQSARTAAPTCKMPIVIQSTGTVTYLDRIAQCRPGAVRFQTRTAILVSNSS